tara:strand:+ start:463 stop:1659 length:1197 start_codon:yes stop_codon:yes gene_type:complete
MTIPNIKLTSLEYSDIYNQIVDYIKDKEEFTDFDFEGSALATITDLLAYNTFYQIIFQNIMVNEMFIDSAQKLESIISHAKLQGYAVPGKQSALASVRIRNVGDGTSSITAYTKFQGSKTDSDVKLFYNIDPIYIDSSSGISQGTGTIYEAKTAVVKQRIIPDVDEQSAFIPESNIDIKTLKVEVDLDGSGNYSTYRLASSVETNISSSDGVFFIERRQSGYDIIFGGLTDPLTGNLITSKITTQTNIRISYLVPSGTEGNGYSNFSFVGSPQAASATAAAPTIGTNTEVVSTSGLSQNGKNAPSINSLKFFVPRYFAAQDRAITKSDITSLLVNSGYANSSDDVTVVGGEELSTPELGTIYISISGVDSTDDIAISATQLIQSKASLGMSVVYGVPG